MLLIWQDIIAINDTLNDAYVRKIVVYIFFVYYSISHLDLLSFPTRRSSDLVEPDGALDVTAVIGGGVHVDLDELHLGIARVLGDPCRVDQHLGMRVVSLLELCRGLRHLMPLLKVDSSDSQTQQSGLPSLPPQ